MCIKKLCNTCGRTLPLTNEHFAYKNKELGTYHSECKVCTREKMNSAYAAKNPNAKRNCSLANRERIKKMNDRMAEFLNALTPLCRH